MKAKSSLIIVEVSRASFWLAERSVVENYFKPISRSDCYDKASVLWNAYVGTKSFDKYVILRLAENKWCVSNQTSPGHKHYEVFGTFASQEMANRILDNLMEGHLTKSL